MVRGDTAAKVQIVTLNPKWFRDSTLSLSKPESVEPAHRSNIAKMGHKTTSVRDASPDGSMNQTEGFDPGSERTLAAWLRHASRTERFFEQSDDRSVAKGCVIDR